MCAHTTWNPPTITHMGFPLTNVYNNTFKGKNNSKGKHIITALQHKQIIYIQIPLKVRQFSALRLSGFAFRHVFSSRVLYKDLFLLPLGLEGNFLEALSSVLLSNGGGVVESVMDGATQPEGEAVPLVAANCR